MNASVLANTSQMPHIAWLKERRKGIGGSDVAKITGHSRWGTAMSVWLDKTGQVEPEETDSEAAEIGTDQEEYVAWKFCQRYERDTGNKIRVRRCNKILQHPQYPWMLANVDRIIVGVDEGLECKTASEYLKDDWKDDEVPTSYYLQCQHYMAVTGYKRWWIAVLIGGNKFRYKCIDRDEAVIDHLIKLEDEFWNQHVVPGLPPEVDGSEASTQVLSQMYPSSNGQAIELAPDASQWVAQLNEAETHIKEWELKRDEAANHLKNMLGEFETGWSGEKKVSWKSYTTNRLDTKLLKAELPDVYEKYVKLSESRRFTVK